MAYKLISSIFPFVFQKLYKEFNRLGRLNFNVEKGRLRQSVNPAEGVFVPGLEMNVNDRRYRVFLIATRRCPCLRIVLLLLRRCGFC